MDFSLEKNLQDEIYLNQNIQKDICSCLNIDFDKFEPKKEDTYINGIRADFTFFENKKVKAIVECKGGKIGVNDYVRGIGQIFQYEFFAEFKISGKNYNFVDFDEFSSVYIFPDSVLRSNDFNIGLFKYPKTKKIIEINSNNLAVRLIEQNELDRLKESKQANLKVISQYYIRDNRLFEIYFLLKVLLIFKLKNRVVNRKKLESKILSKTQTINNQNWRNAFISLKSLGFTDNNNYPTQAGINFANMSFEKFAVMIFYSYLSPYYDLLLKILSKKPNLKNNEISNEIKKENEILTDILFLTQSNGRYISSWLSIARDDFGIIDFEPRNNKRVVKFNPFLSNEKAFEKHILENSKYFDFKNKFDEVINEL